MTMQTDNLEKAKQVTDTLGAVRSHAEKIADEEAPIEHTDTDEENLEQARRFVLQWVYKKQDALTRKQFDEDEDVDLLTETLMCLDYFTNEPTPPVAEELYERLSKIYTAMVMHTTMLHAKEESTLEKESDRTYY